MLKTEKINNEKVFVLQTEPEDITKNKGYKLIPNLNTNIFLVGRKASGKSSVIFTILKKCMDKETKLYAFVGTHSKDPTYIAIKEWLDLQEIKYEFFDNIIDGKTNHLSDILTNLKKDEEKKAEEPAKEKPIIDKYYDYNL
jgi:hypothetical protein